MCYQTLLWSSCDLGQVYKNKPHWFPVSPKVREGGDRTAAAVATTLLLGERASHLLVSGKFEYEKKKLCIPEQENFHLLENHSYGYLLISYFIFQNLHISLNP